ncbi:CRTAC1 family protein [Roseiconus nitratireducens]|nr:CRTAC1 family protein [Roseiconus nitratireducens]
MRAAQARGDWNAAWAHSSSVLLEHSDDAEVVASVARVAHSVGKPGLAADLLADACRAENFASPQRVEQTVIAMVAVGRFYDALAWMEEVLQAKPDQHHTRRLLYDYYVGSENRQAALPHGRYLVRHRQFDLDLLTSFGYIETRRLDPKPLEQMTERYPADRRPLLALARNRYDSGKFDQAIEVLRSIIDQHPEWAPAHVLLGRALIAAGSFDELADWHAHLPADALDDARYWMTLGDWAEFNGQPSQALRSYFQAAQQDPDSVAIWSRLASVLTKNPSSEISDATRQAVRRRVDLLSQLGQHRKRLEKLKQPSRAVAADIARTLMQLGRLWEAEAWAAVAMTFPQQQNAAPNVDVQQVRQTILAKLRRDLPWQQTEGHPELESGDAVAPNVAAITSGDHSPATEGSPSRARSSGRLHLVEEAQQRELDFFGFTADDLHEPGIMLHETLGCGGAAVDFDLDGWCDLYLVAAGGMPGQRDSAANALLRNLDGTFRQSTEPSGTGDRGFGQGVAVGDINEDGFPDLLVLNYGPNAVLINRGDGTFRDASREFLPQPDAIQWSTSAAVADIDRDGINDAVVLNYCAGMEPVTEKCLMTDSTVYRSCSPMVFPAENDVFYQGTGDGKFVDRTQQWNATPAIPGRGLGIVIGSLTGNGAADIFVANDMTNNHLWSARGEGKDFQLSEAGVLAGLSGDGRSIAQGSMGIATGDLDRDGDIDMYVTNFEKEYNTLHEQTAPGLWTDATAARDLLNPTMPMVGFGTEAIDFDNNGDLELIVTNGHVDLFARGDERSVYLQPLQIFRRDGAPRYTVVNDSDSKYLAEPHVGRALWTLDVNRDGLTDVGITHQTEAVALLVNHSQSIGRWIELELRGTSSSRDAIGAVVSVSAGDQTWTASLNSGDGYLCSNERVLHFGLGEVDSDVEVSVRWPTGQVQPFPGLETGKRWLLIEDQPSFALEP